MQAHTHNYTTTSDRSYNIISINLRVDDIQLLIIRLIIVCLQYPRIKSSLFIMQRDQSSMSKALHGVLQKSSDSFCGSHFLKEQTLQVQDICLMVVFDLIR